MPGGMSQGPEMSLKDAQAKVATLTAPRVTEAAIQAKIKEVEYVNPFSANSQLTVCAITMENGFTVIGKSAPASAENYDMQVGRRYAYEDAFKQLWALEAYELKSKLSGT